MAAKILGLPESDVQMLSFLAGISFRKAVLQKLKDAGLQPTQIATYASHKSINSQMSYVAETYQANGDIAAALYDGLA